MLETLSSGHITNLRKYEKYALDNAHFYVGLHQYHPMNPKVQKLSHVILIIKNALLPILQLLEEAEEERNKHGYGAKTSRRNSK